MFSPSVCLRFCQKSDANHKFSRCVTEVEAAATASFVISEKLGKTAGAIAFQSSLLRVPGKTVVLMRQEGEQFDVCYHRCTVGRMMAGSR